MCSPAPKSNPKIWDCKDTTYSLQVATRQAWLASQEHVPCHIELQYFGCCIPPPSANTISLPTRQQLSVLQPAAKPKTNCYWCIHNLREQTINHQELGDVPASHTSLHLHVYLRVTLDYGKGPWPWTFEGPGNSSQRKSVPWNIEIRFLWSQAFKFRV